MMDYQTFCVALHNYKGSRDDELSLRIGDIVKVFKRADDGWWFGYKNLNNIASTSPADKGSHGWFPSNFAYVPENGEFDLSQGYYLQSQQQQQQQQQSQQQLNQPQSQPDLQRYAKVQYDYVAQEEDELDLTAGDIVVIINTEEDDGWHRGILKGKLGLFPANFVSLLLEKDVLSSAVNTSNSQVSSKIPNNRRSSLAVDRLIQLQFQQQQQQQQPSHLQNAGFENQKVLSTVMVSFDYNAQQPDELQLKKGTLVDVIHKQDDGWWTGVDLNGQVGVFPYNFCRELTPEERKQYNVSPGNGINHRQEQRGGGSSVKGAGQSGKLPVTGANSNATTASNESLKNNGGNQLKPIQTFNISPPAVSKKPSVKTPPQVKPKPQGIQYGRATDPSQSQQQQSSLASGKDSQEGGNSNNNNAVQYKDSIAVNTQKLPSLTKNRISPQSNGNQKASPAAMIATQGQLSSSPNSSQSPPIVTPSGLAINSPQQYFSSSGNLGQSDVKQNEGGSSVNSSDNGTHFDEDAKKRTLKKISDELKRANSSKQSSGKSAATDKDLVHAIPQSSVNSQSSVIIRDDGTESNDHTIVVPQQLANILSDQNGSALSATSYTDAGHNQNHYGSVDNNTDYGVDSDQNTLIVDEGDFVSQYAAVRSPSSLPAIDYPSTAANEMQSKNGQHMHQQQPQSQQFDLDSVPVNVQNYVNDQIQRMKLQFEKLLQEEQDKRQKLEQQLSQLYESLSKK
ncbi:hypothetical protein MP228_012495 [Amoeboaphelidium protococcarum]|nr:hypothetical protein MP228_012495 [Amoeboaphelidium protococcarum]